MLRPNFRVAPRIACATLVLTLVACGSDSPSDPLDLGASMSARIDGQAWNATIALGGPPDAFTAVSGSDGNRTIAFAFPGNQGPGTFTIGGTVGVNANLTIGATQWVAGIQGGSGAITVTTISQERIAGTFAFTMEAAETGTNPSTRTVTEGQFDITR